MRRIWAQTDRAIWWTQAKLTSVFVAINGVAFGAIAFATPETTRRLLLLVTVQVGLVYAYRSIALSLGELHLAGQTREAFRARLWDATWKPRFSLDDDDYQHAAATSSFYRRILGASDEVGAALYEAMASWEGRSLTGDGRLNSLLVAVSASTLGLALQDAQEGQTSVVLVTLVFGFVVPTYASVTIEALTLLSRKRATLPRGQVQRLAILAPRTREDLGLPPYNGPSGWDNTGGRATTIALVVSLGLPAVIIAALLDSMLILGMGVAVLVFLVLLHRAMIHLVVTIIPFVRFAGPIEVSILLDMRHRHQAFMSSTALTFLVVIGALRWGADSLGPGLGLGQNIFLATWWAIILTCVTWGDQLAGYPGFMSPGAFERAFRRSVAKSRSVKP